MPSPLNSNKGYVLPYILLLILIATTLLLGYLSVIYFYNIQSVKLLKKKKLDFALQSAIQLLLSNSEKYKYQNSISIDSTIVLIQKNYLGLFDEYTLSAKDQFDSSKVIYLIGDNIPGFAQNALVVTRPNLRITVAGSTNIKGNILATSNNFSKGNIFGIKNTNSQFLDGNILVNENLKSKIFPDSIFTALFSPPDEFQFIDINSIDFNSDFVNSSPNTFLNTDELNISGSLINSSSRKFKLISRDNCTISASTNSNMPIEVYSDSNVVIKKDVNIENMNIYSSGKITIESNCRFKNVQFFSKKGIEVVNSNFNYPSVISLIVNSEDFNNLSKELSLKSTIVNGTVMLISSVVGSSSNQSKITVDEKSIIHGFIYCENNLELLGKLYGTAYTYNTYYYKEPTQYINWLVDMNITRDKLDKWFRFPIGFSETSNFDIIKETWIY